MLWVRWRRKRSRAATQRRRGSRASGSARCWVWRARISRARSSIARPTGCARPRRADRRLRARPRAVDAGRRRRGSRRLGPVRRAAFGLAHRIARDAQVISPLGVALALVRDVVERTIVDPGPVDLARIRREAIDAAVAAGAAPDRVDVVVEIDTARNRVRATASGATALVEGPNDRGRGRGSARSAAAQQLRTDAAALTLERPPAASACSHPNARVRSSTNAASCA